MNCAMDLADIYVLCADSEIDTLNCYLSKTKQPTISVCEQNYSTLVQVVCTDPEVRYHLKSHWRSMRKASNWRGPGKHRRILQRLGNRLLAQAGNQDQHRATGKYWQTQHLMPSRAATSQEEAHVQPFQPKSQKTLRPYLDILVRLLLDVKYFKILNKNYGLVKYFRVSLSCWVFRHLGLHKLFFSTEPKFYIFYLIKSQICNTCYSSTCSRMSGSNTCQWSSLHPLSTSRTTSGLFCITQLPQ